MDLARLDLAPHVRACVDADCVIMLDLRGNRYWAVPLARFEGADAAAPAAIGRLQTLGLVRAQGQAGLRYDASQPAAAPDREYVSDLGQAPETTPVRGGGAGAVMAACGRAVLDLAAQRLDRTMTGFARRKARAGRPYGDIGRDVACFQRHRPWFPARRVCLFDSIALMHFLLGRGHAPDLVIGARARPFAAHCWVSHKGAVLNDALDACAGFVPLAGA